MPCIKRGGGGLELKDEGAQINKEKGGLRIEQQRHINRHREKVPHLELNKEDNLQIERKKEFVVEQQR